MLPNLKLKLWAASNRYLFSAKNVGHFRPNQIMPFKHGPRFLQILPLHAIGKKERYLFLHNLISTIAYFPWLSIMTSPLPKNKMTFLMAKILDQFQMAFEFLPYDVMVSFHFQIWPWCSLKIGEKVQISHLPSRDADDNEFQLVFMEGKFALLHTYLLRYQWSRGDICSLILSLTLLKKFPVTVTKIYQITGWNCLLHHHPTITKFLKCNWSSQLKNNIVFHKEAR